MEVSFGDSRLERCYKEHEQAVKKWGPVVARKYILRIDIIYAAKTLEELFSSKSLRLHSLKGERAGEYAITLHDRWRLIIVRDGDRGIQVKEVTSHYGD